MLYSNYDCIYTDIYWTLLTKWQLIKWKDRYRFRESLFRQNEQKKHVVKR